MPVTTAVERMSAADSAELEWESAKAPMHIAAILRVEKEIDLAELRSVLAGRIRGVPRLRQRLVRPSPRSRRASWADDPHFALERHVSAMSCPAPGDENALLEVAATEGNRYLPRDRPLWRLVLVTGLRDGGAALVVVIHHAVADGIGGLAVLAELMDRPPPPAGPPSPPSGSASADSLTAARTRRAVIRSVRTRLGLLSMAMAELLAGVRDRPPRCSLNQPIGAVRHLAVVRTPLAPLVRTARGQAATVNDVLLVATVDALHHVLVADGEAVDALTVSVPVSRRATTTATHLGNAVGVMPVSVPCHGPLLERLRHVAQTTRQRRPSGHGDPSTMWLGPVFTLLVRLGLFQWFVRRQHLVNTFVTNVRGPTRALTLGGVRVDAVIPFSPIAGNVTVAFTAFSYAGTLSITVVADGDRWPDANRIAVALDEALDGILRVSAGSPGGPNQRDL